MKKTDLKSGLIFALIMISLDLISAAWTGEAWTAPYFIAKAVVSGVFKGIIFAFLFPWLLGSFRFSPFLDTTMKIALEPGEDIVFQTGANHFKGIEGVGGKLYLTNKRLVFKSHKLNIQNHELSIDLDEIKKVERSKTVGLVDNGLTVTSGDNKMDKFVVENAEEWVEKMSSLVAR